MHPWPTIVAIVPAFDLFVGAEGATQETALGIGAAVSMTSRIGKRNHIRDLTGSRSADNAGHLADVAR